MKKYKITHSDLGWRQKLTSDEYHILREKGTEPAFSGKYWKNKAEGIYTCAACSNKLFSSDTKFDSGSGWPSFWEPIEGIRVDTEMDAGHGMIRTEVKCGQCGSHLGHVFGDGPLPTHQRYCINSASLGFKPEAGEEEDAEGS